MQRQYFRKHTVTVILNSEHRVKHHLLLEVERRIELVVAVHDL